MLESDNRDRLCAVYLERRAETMRGAERVLGIRAVNPGFGGGPQSRQGG
ncbi:hypothetical protein GCM10010384_33080 [Streptomyces djakartensis]|uniref:Uncharacterized protein n=1 Tax=Streptomyces djakartensis TaxID=68193 RepID=A0ABQ2ZUI5_9ACTN|nr:hypothetical protein GCM10010384_33080 [Streptomyces djakartensis]